MFLFVSVYIYGVAVVQLPVTETKVCAYEFLFLCKVRVQLPCGFNARARVCVS